MYYTLSVVEYIEHIVIFYFKKRHVLLYLIDKSELLKSGKYIAGTKYVPNMSRMSHTNYLFITILFTFLFLHPVHSFFFYITEYRIYAYFYGEEELLVTDE